jgi:acetyl esterase
VRDLALRTGYPVVFPEYTLAPEVHFPVQHDQCYDSLKWLTENGETLGLQGTNFTIVGDSAGGKLDRWPSIFFPIYMYADSVTGHLAAGLNIMSIEKKEFKIPSSVLISPITSTDATAPLTASEQELFGGPFISVPILRAMADYYIPRQEDRVTPIGSPRSMPDELAAQFPPTLIVVSSADVLRSGGELLGEKLQGQGVDCAVVVGHGQLHDTVVSEAARNGPTPKALMTLIAGEIKERLAG